MIVSHVKPESWGDTGEAGKIQPSEVAGLAHAVSLEAADIELLRGPEGPQGPQGPAGQQGEPGPSNLTAGNLVFSGVGQRIVGDFTNAIVANRVTFQTSVENGNTTHGIMPNGSGLVANFAAYGNGSDPGNSSAMFVGVSANGTEVSLQSAVTGAGTYLPLTFYTGGSERVRIDTSGNVLVKSAAGLGYGQGAGGTVTQATSKSTSVTLNRSTGQITMNRAALAANTGVIFQVNNSLVSAADGIIVTMQAGMVSGGAAYNAWASGAGAGKFFINLKNISNVSLSEAVVINFAIIKGSAA